MCGSILLINGAMFVVLDSAAAALHLFLLNEVSFDFSASGCFLPHLDGECHDFSVAL